MAAEVTGEICGHSVDYRITGTREEVTQAIAEIMRLYPTPGYGTYFNWPPDGPNKKYLVPQDLGNGRWIARGSSSTSCD